MADVSNGKKMVRGSKCPINPQRRTPRVCVCTCVCVCSWRVYTNVCITPEFFIFFSLNLNLTDPLRLAGGKSQDPPLSASLALGCNCMLPFNGCFVFVWFLRTC